MGVFMKKSKCSEILYFLAFFLFGFANIVITNSFLFGTSEYRHEISNYFYYIAAALFILSFIQLRIRPAVMIKRVVLCAVALLVTAKIHLIGFGVSILAVIAAYRIDFRKIVKWCIYTNLFYLYIVIFSSFLGLVPDDTYEHYGRTAHCLGFVYYSNVPFMVLMIFLLSYWLVRNKHLENILLVTGLIINCILYEICTVRLVLLLYIIFFIMAISAKLLKMKKENKCIYFAAISLYPAAAIITIIASLKVHAYPVLMKIDNVLNSRLSLNYKAFILYHVKLFGQKIETSKEWIDENYINHYFYIDSGYINALLNYGIIIFLLLILSYALLAYYAIKSKDKKLFVCCTVICGFTIINNILFNVVLNPFPMLAINAFLESRKICLNKGI